MPHSENNPLLDAVARAERRLAELDAERAAVVERLDELRGRLVSPGTPHRPDAESEAPPRSKLEKVALFRRLFTGRSDVFPKQWENRATKRRGYGPACANEWVSGVCEKPRVRCGECPNQAFLEVTDPVYLDHLQGRHVIGVYPLLPDETCRFIAVDFDKGDWREDVAAYAATSRRFGLTPAVERSSSGKGAHVWFFFESPVPAADARAMASYLLTETMAARPELPMNSYDRLFPNQDTMPRGGFGNLIALPLQYAARRRGNTVFVDDTWEPFPDQWSYLDNLPRICPSRVAELAREASATGRILGVRESRSAIEGEQEPWLLPPSRDDSPEPVRGPLPTRVRIVSAQRLFIEKRDLPPALVNQINRLAAFSNPQFHEKQAMRLSTARTPRIIHCAENLPAHVALPRGCRAALEAVLAKHGIKPVVEDNRTEGNALAANFRGELTGLQERAVQALAAEDTGIFVAPPGTGKTVVGAHLIARRGRNTLVIVHRTQLMDQWRAQLGLFLDLEAKEIGQIGGGRRRRTGVVDIAMIQSLVHGERVADLVADYGHVLVDECHHVPAVSFERVMREVRARYVTGLTATPTRRDGHHPILTFQMGPIRYAVDPKKEAARRGVEHRLIVRDTDFRIDEASAALTIHELYGRLAADGKRNEMILDDVVRSLEERRSPVVLTERRDHVELLADRLRRVARNVVVLRGGMGIRQRREAAETLASIPVGEERVLVATGRFIGEGFDDARLDTLYLTLPVSWKGTLVQYAGRLHRRHQGKTDVRIWDYVDRGVPMLDRMFERRLKGYRAMGYHPEAAPSMGAGRREWVVELDENAGWG